MTVNSLSENRVRKLALLGGAPAFNEQLHVGRPNLGRLDRFQELVNSIWERNWLTNAGPLVYEFEKRIADFAGVNECVCMCNATVALEIVARALGLAGEVIVPSFTFVATAHSLQWQQIQPVFCDIDPVTHTLDPECIERLITPRTSGIVGVHIWGRSCNVEALQDIARRRQLKLVFDAAHAFACSHRASMIGGFGNAEVYSFHATKFVNSFEGGAVVTNDAELAQRMRLMRNFGFEGLDQVGHVGTNGKMTEVTAAMGLTSLESMDAFVAQNFSNFQLYRCLLEGLPGITVLDYDASERCNYQYVVLEVDEDYAGLSRDDLMAVLHAENIRARRYFWPGVHRMEPYRSLYPQSHLWLPNTERVAGRVLLLPTGIAVTSSMVEKICDVVRTAIGEADAVSRMNLTLT